MIKKFDEFVSEQDEINEGKLKDVILATSIATSLMFGSNFYKNHDTINHEPIEVVQNVEDEPEIEQKQEEEKERVNFAETYYPSDEILDYIKKIEGWHEGWKDDGKGNKTTGWGFKATAELLKKYPDGMTKPQADKYFKDVAIPERVKIFKKSVPNINEYSQRQLDALFDLFYNIGSSKFTKGSPNLQNALENIDIAGVINNMDHDYNNKKVPGIKIRRDFERDLFMQDVNKENIS